MPDEVNGFNFLNKRELTDCLTGEGQHQGRSNNSKNQKFKRTAETDTCTQLQTQNKTQLKPIREGQPTTEWGQGQRQEVANVDIRDKVKAGSKHRKVN